MVKKSVKKELFRISNQGEEKLLLMNKADRTLFFGALGAEVGKSIVSYEYNDGNHVLIVSFCFEDSSKGLDKEYSIIKKSGSHKTKREDLEELVKKANNKKITNESLLGDLVKAFDSGEIDVESGGHLVAYADVYDLKTNDHIIKKKYIDMSSTDIENYFTGINEIKEHINEGTFGESVLDFLLETANMLTIDDFDKKYTLIKDAGEAFPDNPGRFETYGEDLKFVKNFIKKHGEKRVWTEIDGEYGTMLVAGFRSVNRICYEITNEEWKSDDEEYLID